MVNARLAGAGLAALVLLASAAQAQPKGVRVIVVPSDGGVASGSAEEVPPAEPAPTTRTLEAVPPPPLPPEALDRSPPPLRGPPTSAMIDGHPREGSFLSGPGSFTFIMHHTLMTGLGGLATQMIPRALSDPTHFGDEGARLAYLGLGLGGAALGFAGSAIWQFTHWMGPVTANTGIVTSFFGGMLLGGFADLLTTNLYTVSWMTVIGNTLGAWLLAVVGGGDLSVDRSAFVLSGGFWAAVYTAVIVAIIATTGGALTGRNVADVIMITPALGAGALALASLKFNPSLAQIMRANLFGLGAGAVFLLVSALVLTAHFASPVPYILGGVAAIGAQTLVSLLWADTAEPAPALPVAPGSSPAPRTRVSPWW